PDDLCRDTLLAAARLRPPPRRLVLRPLLLCLVVRGIRHVAVGGARGVVAGVPRLPRAGGAAVLGVVARRRWTRPRAGAHPAVTAQAVPEARRRLVDFRDVPG